VFTNKSRSWRNQRLAIGIGIGNRTSASGVALRISACVPTYSIPYHAIPCPSIRSRVGLDSNSTPINVRAHACALKLYGKGFLLAARSVFPQQRTGSVPVIRQTTIGHWCLAGRLCSLERKASSKVWNSTRTGGPGLQSALGFGLDLGRGCGL